MKKIFIAPVVMITLTITVSQAYAWVEPDQLPPNGNIAAPLNSGSFAQSKIGGLILGLGNTLYGLIVKNGNSGFGTETPTEKVDVNGNIKLNGRIIGLQAPTDDNDAVNKGYVDAVKTELELVKNQLSTIANTPSINWNNPTNYSVNNPGRSPSQVTLTTPIPYKLCVLRHEYVEQSGRCVMSRNDDGTWFLDGAAAGYLYVSCAMYCYN